VKTYLVRLYNEYDQVTMEEEIDAECIGEAIKKAEGIKNDANAMKGYSKNFVLKAITIKEQ